MPRPRSTEALWQDTQVAADQAVEGATIASKAARRAEALVPKRDPRDAPWFSDFVAAGLRAAALISPRKSWPELGEIDSRLVGLDVRQEEIRQAQIEARSKRENAEQRHANALALWHADGQKGKRPVSDAAALDAEIADLAAEYLAVDRLRDQVLGERVAFVERNRKRLVRDAHEATAEARDHVLSLVNQLEQARQELVDRRQTEIWASIFPSESLSTTVPSDQLAPSRRIRERVTPRTQGDFLVHEILALWREDANYWSTVATREQAAEAADKTVAELTGEGAMWAGSAEDIEFQKREKKRLIEEHAKIWGSPPAEFGG